MFKIKAKEPRSFSISWSQPDYNLTGSVTVKWEMKDTMCKHVSNSNSTSVDIGEIPLVISGLEEYSCYNITVCIEEIMVCDSVDDTTAQSGKI